METEARRLPGWALGLNPHPGPAGAQAHAPSNPETPNPGRHPITAPAQDRNVTNDGGSRGGTRNGTTVIPALFPTGGILGTPSQLPPIPGRTPGDDGAGESRGKRGPRVCSRCTGHQAHAT